MRVQVTGTVAFDTLATVERLPARDETARIQRFREEPGGAAGNVAVGLARLGLAPRLVAAVGYDFAGSAYERACRDAGVDLDGLVRVEDTPTAHAVSVSDPAGSQHVYFYPGAAYALADARPVPADVGHFCAGPLDVYAPLMDACGTVTLDPGQELFHRAVEDVTSLLSRVDVLFLNAHELARLTDAAKLDVPALLAAGPGVVVVTHGADGQVVHEASGAVTAVPAVDTDVVEPTGAGDAHRAGFVYALARGADPVSACRVGSVLAAFAVNAMGTQAGLPTLDAARTRYEKAFGAWPIKDDAA